MLAALLAVGCPNFDKLMGRHDPVTTIPDCAAFGVPRYVKAAAPEMSAGFGSVLAMEDQTLFAVAPTEGVATGGPLADPPIPTVECPARPVPVAASGAVHEVLLDPLVDLGPLSILDSAEVAGAVGAFAEDGARGGLPKLDRDNGLMDSGAVYVYRLPRLGVEP